MRRSVRIAGIIDDSPISGLQVRVLVFCFLIVLLDGFDTAVIGYVAPELIGDWELVREQLAPAFGAGLFGMLVGAVCCGPLADRFGRKRVLLGGILVFALGTLAAAFSTGLEMLVVLRFVTGIGLGGVLPNCITLSSEYAPQRRRVLLATLSYSGFILGLALGGSVAAWLMPVLGWKGMLALGGLAPLVLVPALLRWLPESLYFLVGRPEQQATLLQVVKAIGGERDWSMVRLVGDLPEQPRSPVSTLFEEGQALRTLMLWLTFFCGLFVFYLLTNWLPTILRSSGYGPSESAHVASMIPMGGVLGSIVMALLLDRVGPRWVLPLQAAFSAVALGLIGTQLGSATQLMAMVFIAGFGLSGLLANLSIVAATLYPVSARATGVSWALSAGRAGSIVGSMLGAWLFTWAGSLQGFFLWIAVPVLVASLALGVMGWRHVAAVAMARP